MRTSDTGAVKSAGRTLDLLELIADAQAPLSFHAVAAALDIPASSLSQLLATLSARGYVEHPSQRGGYVAGPGFDRLVARLWHRRTLAEQVRPLLEELCAGLGESIGLNVLNGDETVVVAAIHPERDLMLRIRIGATAPLYAVAAGKLLLAAQDDAEIDAYLGRTRLAKLTERTLDAAGLHRAIIAIRSEGIARSVEEASAGIVGLASLLRSGGKPVAALTVGLPSARYDAAADRRISDALLQAAARFAAVADAVRTPPPG